jgi:hypothetical protein
MPPVRERGREAATAMPTDARVDVYRCASCQTVLNPQPGDCCVSCLSGDRACPIPRDVRWVGFVATTVVRGEVAKATDGRAIRRRW